MHGYDKVSDNAAARDDVKMFCKMWVKHPEASPQVTLHPAGIVSATSSQQTKCDHGVGEDAVGSWSSRLENSQGFLLPFLSHVDLHMVNGFQIKLRIGH